MGNLIKRFGSETYPSASGGAAISALTNRNVAGLNALTAPFTPNNSLVGAILFTPRVSGVIQVASSMLIQNGGTADTYAMALEILPGTGLSVSGGEVTENGWVMGTVTPPVIGGVTGSPVLALESLTALAGSASGSLSAYGISPPLPVGDPVVAVILMTQIGGGHSLSQVVFSNISILELP